MPPRRKPRAALRVERVGVPRESWRDVYHFLLVQPWSVFFALVVALYLGLNLVFAFLYTLQPGSVAATRPGVLSDAFFFSVETMATIGYGVMHPETLYAHILVTTEALLGILFVPLATGLIIAKFTRPSARVLFSRNLVLSRFEGVPTLMFRAANIRANQIVEARMNFTLARTIESAEGHRIRRIFDLALLRHTNPQFALSWTVMHPVDANSPLFGFSEAQWHEPGLMILAVITGIDATTSATVHARHAYRGEDVLIAHEFEDILTWRGEDVVHIDYRRFHATRPSPVA
jgi:inward rectifier potassium channel